MNSLTLLGIETVLCFITLFILYKKYKVEGIYTYTIIAFILSCLMSLKTITIYNFDLNLGIVPFITIFTAFNILIQKRGPEEPKKLLLTLIISSIVSYTIMYLATYLNSSNINLFTSASYDNIWSNSLRIYFANFVTILYSLLLNGKLYYYLKKNKNNILISNLFTVIIIQFLASVLFGIVAYTFIKNYIDIIKIVMIRYLLSLIIGLLGTIVIQITKNIKEK